MRRSVATDERIWPRSSALRNPTETLPGSERAFGGRRYHALALEDMGDRGRIEAAGTAEKNGSSQQAYVGFVVQTVAALRPLRGHQSERFPRAQSRRGNAHAARHFADAQEALPVTLGGLRG